MYSSCLQGQHLCQLCMSHLHLNVSLKLFFICILYSHLYYNNICIKKQTQGKAQQSVINMQSSYMPASVFHFILDLQLRIKNSSVYIGPGICGIQASNTPLPALQFQLAMKPSTAIFSS